MFPLSRNFCREANSFRPVAETALDLTALFSSESCNRIASTSPLLRRVSFAMPGMVRQL